MTQFPAVLMLVVLCVSANAQPAANSPQTAPASRDGGPGLDKADLLRRSSFLEDAIRKAELAHESNSEIARLYDLLGEVYQNLGWYPKAEADMRKTISLLKDGPQAQLAETLGHLAVLHIAMGEDRLAEKDHLRALQIRETVGDPIGLALTWNDLADLYCHDRRYSKALDYAQRAMAVVAGNPQLNTDIQVGIRQTLGFALCADGRCREAIPILKDALEFARAGFGPDSLSVGMAKYVLGLASWHSGDMTDAARWLKAGTERMKVDLGWGHKLYIDALEQYSLFLRENRQREQAAAVDRERQMLTTAVDVHALADQSDKTTALGFR